MLEKSLNIRGVEWEYRTGGHGSRTILMFHGAVGGAETLDSLADEFSDDYRVIAPTIAPVDTLDEVSDAASAILDREHVGRAIVFGGSFGGLIAQAFLKRNARQVEDLVLLSTGAPNPALGKRNERLLKVAGWLPFRLTRAILKSEISRHLKAPAQSDAETMARIASFRTRLDDYFDNKLTKEVFLSRIRLSVDFCRNETYAAHDYDDWPGRILILESDDDPMITADERHRLRETYPRALCCTFDGAGHMVPLLRTAELVGVVKAFMEEHYERPGFEEHCALVQESLLVPES